MSVRPGGAVQGAGVEVGLGRYVRFNPDDLKEWLRENRIDPPANGFRLR
jgi:hypothetical protein